MPVRIHKLGKRLLAGSTLWLRVVLLVFLFATVHTSAQDAAPATFTKATAADDSQAEPVQPDDPLTTMLHHAEWDHWWVSGQANFISQWHPEFHSPYQGKNSLSPEAQDASSRVLTLFTGWRPTDSTEFLCDVQETGGHGLGEALAWIIHDFAGEKRKDALKD